MHGQYSQEQECREHDRQLISQGGRGLLNSACRGSPPLARGVPGNTAGRGSVEAAAVSIAGGGPPPARGGGFVGATNLWCFGRGVWHVTHVFPPFWGVSPGLTGPVSIGKDGGHGG
jgi:hypothetical protein